MKKDKKTRELYSSPQVDVIETLAQSVICESNTERPTDGSPEWGWIVE